MENLKLNEIRKARKERERIKFETFDAILGECNKKITYYAEQGRTECIYEVPPIVLGRPPYDLDECCKYIIEQLEATGEFTSIAHAFPNKICVWWSLD